MSAKLKAKLKLGSKAAQAAAAEAGDQRPVTRATRRFASPLAGLLIGRGMPTASGSPAPWAAV